MKDFTKADLKNRMIVETRRGDRFIVIDDILVGRTMWYHLDEYQDNLTYPKLDNFDIVKVYDQVKRIDGIDDHKKNEQIMGTSRSQKSNNVRG